MNRTILKYGIPCCVCIVVYCLIYLITQTMKMDEKWSLFLSVCLSTFVASNLKRPGKLKSS